MARWVFAIALACHLISLTPLAHAEDWRWFGGSPSRNPVSRESNPPTWWQTDEKNPKNILWTASMGRGNFYLRTLGDPVVANGLIWIGTNATDDNEGREKNFYQFLCLDDKTGKPLYRYRLPIFDDSHSMASSPLVDGDRMWFFNNHMEVVCLDLEPLYRRKGDPREVWKLDSKKLGVVHGRSHFDCRLCSVSMHRDWLYVITGNGVHYVDGKRTLNDAAPSLICIDKNSGKLVWQDNSPGKEIYLGQFASPTVITVNGKTQVVAPQGDGWLRSFDAATGKLIWKFDANPPDARWDDGNGNRNYLSATAVFHDNRIFIGNGRDLETSYGRAGFLYCIDATKSGDISQHLPDGAGKSRANPNSGMIWQFGGVDDKTQEADFHCTLSNVAIDQGLLIAADAAGFIYCLDAKTGKRHWRHGTNGIVGSPLIVDKKVYVADVEGIVWIFELSAEKKLLGKIEMPDGIRASPIFANGVLYLAANWQLFAITGRTERNLAVVARKIDAAVAAEMKRQKVPGVALAIIDRGEPVLVKGYGEANVEHHVAVTADTIFQSGSVGKQFTAAAIMTLVDDGKLSLDDSLGKFWPDAPAWWRPVTIRHLLTHTSGMGNFEPNIGIDYRKDYTDEDFARLALALKPEFPPGNRWSYSNPGFVLLGCIISKVTGKHYGELLRERVFRPLGMKTARIISETDIIPHRAAGYQLAEFTLKNQDWTSPSLNTTADGALYVTIRDMIAWDKGIRDKALLKPESWKQTFTPVVLKSGKSYPYGFGWFIDEDRGQLRHHHGGAWQGFKTYIARYLGDDLTIILLTNLANAEPDLFTDAIAAAIEPKLALPIKPLPGEEPAVARKVREILNRARAGTLTVADFAHMPTGYFPGLATLHQKLLEPLGNPEKLELVERHQRGDDRWYRWRAAFKSKILEVALSLAPDNRLTFLFVKPVEE